MQKTKKSLMFVVGKTYPVNNHIFKIDIENTRTQGAKYVQSYHKDTATFFLMLTLNMYLFASYLLFIVWMIIIILIIFIVFMICREIGIWLAVSHISIISVGNYVIARGWGLFEIRYCSVIVIFFTYNYLIVDGKRHLPIKRVVKKLRS